MAINKDINKNLMDLLNTDEKQSSSIDSLQSREYLDEKQEQKELVNIDNSSSVFSVRIKKRDVVLLKNHLKKQGIHNFSTGLKNIIYKYMFDNGII